MKSAHPGGAELDSGHRSRRSAPHRTGGVSCRRSISFFQPPLYWQQFEDLANGLLGEVYNLPDAQQFGRPGQSQNGVDVYGRSKRYGMIGVQCKRLADLDPNGHPYPGGPIGRKFLRDAADEALVFKPTLSIWILATTARRDTAVQGWVNEINDEWRAEGRDRRAMVWSWDDIIGYLNGFPELQHWYYEEVIKVRGAKDLDEVILATIAMAFSRPAFEVPLHCESPTSSYRLFLTPSEQCGPESCSIGKAGM